MGFVKTSEACEKLKVHPNTLRRWDKEGLIKTIKTPGGTRMYDIHSVGEDYATKINTSSPEAPIPLTREELFRRAFLESQKVIEELQSRLK